MKLTTAVAKIAAAAEVARAAAQAEARSQAAGADTRAAAAADTEGHLESICDPMDPDAIQEGTMRKRSM